MLELKFLRERLINRISALVSLCFFIMLLGCSKYNDTYSPRGLKKISNKELMDKIQSTNVYDKKGILYKDQSGRNVAKDSIINGVPHKNRHQDKLKICIIND